MSPEQTEHEDSDTDSDVKTPPKQIIETDKGSVFITWHGIKITEKKVKPKKMSCLRGAFYMNAFQNLKILVFKNSEKGFQKWKAQVTVTVTAQVTVRRKMKVSRTLNQSAKIRAKVVLMIHLRLKPEHCLL